MERLLYLLCFVCGGAVVGGLLFAVMHRQARRRVIWKRDEDGFHSIHVVRRAL